MIAAKTTGRGEARVFGHEAYLRSILQTIPDAMIVIDERGSVPTTEMRLVASGGIMTMFKAHAEKREKEAA